jgi:Zn-dependent metalloprotease
VETEPVMLALHQLEQDSHLFPAVSFHKGFPSAMHVRIPVTGAQPEERARQFLRTYKTLLQQPNPDSDLILRKVRPGILDHVRFGQQYHGVPVYGAELVVTLQSNQVHMSCGELLPPTQLDASHLNLIPTLTSNQAQLVCQTLLNRPGAPALHPTELVIFDKALIDSVASDPHLAWQVILGGGKHLELLIEAHTGELLAQFERELSDGAPLDGFDLQLTDAEHEANPSDDNCYNTSDDTDAGDEDGVYSDYLNVPDAVMGYQHACNAYAYFHQNFNWHSYDEESSQIEIFFFADVSNASWSKDCELISVRDGWIDYEVIVHELTHGIIQHSSDLIYMYQPGALNEHYA